MKFFSFALSFVFLLASCMEDLRPASMDGVKYVVYEEFVPYQVMEQVLGFLDWIEERGIPLRWIMFDMEMSIERFRAMEEGGLVDTVIPILKENVDPQGYQRSKQEYAEFVLELRERGYRVTAAAYPFVLDDLKDGDDEIQDAWNTPVGRSECTSTAWMVC